jgi:3-dehydroquinate synthase class II
MVAAGELEAGEEMEAEEEMGDMEELDEMDEVSWKKKNGESLENLAPTKVGQTTVNEAEDVEEVTGASGGYDPGTRAGGGLENIINTLTALIKKGGAGAEKIYAELQQLAAASTSKMGTHSGADPTNEVEMDEMDKMEELKKELQEVNLLNAKLLYTNKIFNSKNLNESQKLRVLKAFDKATSVKEAKVIYETLNEGMTSKTVKTSMMNEIKGSASKATGFISESKQPIVEVDPMVARWQKLAGIK